MLLKLLIFGIVVYFVWYFFQKPKNTKSEGSKNRKQADVKPKFCSECGALLGKNDRFCPVCGVKVTNSERLSRKKYPSKKVPDYSPSSGKKKEEL